MHNDGHLHEYCENRSFTKINGLGSNHPTLPYLVAVIPKEGLAGTSAAKLSFGVSLTIEWYSVLL